MVKITFIMIHHFKKLQNNTSSTCTFFLIFLIECHHHVNTMKHEENVKYISRVTQFYMPCLHHALCSIGPP